MPTFYNYTENGVVYSFDDVFVPADAFRQGNLLTAGFNLYGQLGDNSTTNRSTPVQTSSRSSNWKQVSSGGYHTAAIKTDGTLWTWGTNSYGQLGNNNNTIQRNTPITTFVGGLNWKQVSCGKDFTAAIKSDGTLWVWGRNSSGMIGNNTSINRSIPVTTFAGGTNWKQVSAGFTHTAAIKTDGTLWVWGSNTNGKLGTNNSTDSLTPVTTFAGGNNWKQVDCGNSHTAAIKTNGTLWTWGDNVSGGLGINNANEKSTPVTTFAGGNNWKQVDCGSFYTSAIKTDGTLWVWGSNSYGRLGNNTTTNRSTPVTTFAGGSNWKQVTCGTDHASAIKSDGTLWTWGRNAYGQLGSNDTNGRTTPVTTFAGGTNWKQVSAGYRHTSTTTYIDDYI